MVIQVYSYSCVYTGDHKDVSIDTDVFLQVYSYSCVYTLVFT